MSRYYISGALTVSANGMILRDFYEEIAITCETFGHSVYVPHRHTDPILHTDASPKEVYERDRLEVSKSNCVIAYVGVPSLGVGAEIEIARQCGIPVVLLYEQGSPVSRMARGSPAVVHEIVFDEFSNAIKELRNFLKKQSF